MTKGLPDKEAFEIIGAIMAFYGKSSASPIRLDLYDGETTPWVVEPVDIDPERYRIKEAS